MTGKTSPSEVPSEMKSSDGLTIDVVHLSYGLYLGGTRKFKKILHEISFHLRPGSLCAVMGPSGSGKSTLLDLLADRTLTGEWSGNILFNGGSRSRWFSRDSAYILQDDLHIATLTVRETIYFAACCKLPEGTSQKVIEQRVEELLEITGLNAIRDSIVGDASHKGISGGQLKRLSIAVEIVSLPKTIFLDEPTSGLDSTIALDVMAAIRRIANQNRTCISTIHQPSTAVYEMFDTIVLLSHGHLIYFGPAKDVVAYFTAAPYAYYYIPGQNPAEFILEVSEGVISPVDTNNIMTNVVPTHEQFVRKYQESKYYSTPVIQGQEDNSTLATTTNSLFPVSRKGRLHATTKWTQFKMLLWRDGISIIRDVDAFYAVLAKSIIVGLLIGVVFYRQGVTTVPLFDPYGVPYAEVQNISALLFFGMMHSMVTNIEAIPHICSKNLIFRREVNSFAYSVSPYWLTAMISPLPLQFFGYIIFLSISFFLCAFKRTFDYFIYYAIGVFLANVCSYNVALLLGATVRREGTALVAFPLIFLFFSTFSGYPILIENVPKFWSWAPTINFVRWCYQGLMINQWEGYDSEPNANGSVLALYTFQNWNKYHSFLILLAMFCVTSLLAYVAMRPPSRNLLWFASTEDMGKKYNPSGNEDGGRVYRFSSFLENSFGLSFTTSQDHAVMQTSFTDDAVPSDTFSSTNPLFSVAMTSNQKTKKNSNVDTTSSLSESLLTAAAHNENDLEAVRTTSTSSYQPPTSSSFSSSPHPPSPVGTLRQHSRRLFQKTDDKGFTLTFENIRYDVTIPATATRPVDSNSNSLGLSTASQTLSILRGVSGYAKPGEICALMGSSGAGKTTLLDILAYRKTIGNVTGTICINNRPLTSFESKQLLKQVTAYVMQENVLIGALTVREHLYYAARLRLSYQDFHGDVGIQQRVDDLLTMLGLTHVQHSRVGNEGDRGISGGQKKRVSIGVEFIHFPEIIFLDEPTTGLDSAISFEVMSTVRALADQARTILCTIHQPSPATFALFNTLLLLSAGRVLYFGPAAEAVPFFELGHNHVSHYSFPYLAGSNPAEYVIAVASGAITPVVVNVSDDRKVTDANTVSSDTMADFFLTTSYASLLQALLHPPLMDEENKATIKIEDDNWETVAKKNHVNSVLVQVPVLMSRMFLVKRREYHQLTLSLAKSVIVAVFYGTIFYHLPTGTDPNTYINRISIIFFSLISLIMSHQGDIPDILEQRLLFNRERASQTISTESYWLAKFFLDAPFNAIFVLLYAVIIYQLCSMRSGGNLYFWFFFYMMWVTDIIAYFAAQVVANISPSSKVAMSLFPILMFFALAFEGFIIYVPEFPVWSQWATYVSYLRYSFQGLIVNEFDNNADLPLGPLYLNELGFQHMSKDACAGYLWIFVGFHALLAFLLLKYVNFIKR